MKHYTIEVLPDEPILVVSISEGFKIAEHMPHSIGDVRAVLDQAKEPLFYILDVTKLSLSLDEVIMAASLGARGEQPLWHHPMIREMMFVSPSILIKLAAQGLSAPTFGGLNARIFETLDEALAYARAVLKG
jgi:hypothetical protein